jgi:serine/threonine-protein phosphatase 2A regulatory subunit B'
VLNLCFGFLWLQALRMVLPRNLLEASDHKMSLAAVKELPLLKDVSPQKREALFQQKLQLCSVVFHFDDPASDQRGKDMKRQTLMELLDFVNTQAGEKMFTESLYSDIMAMVSAR